MKTLREYLQEMTEDDWMGVIDRATEFQLQTLKDNREKTLERCREFWEADAELKKVCDELGIEKPTMIMEKKQ